MAYNKRLDVHVEYYKSHRGYEVRVRNTGGLFQTYSVHDDEYDAICDWQDIQMGNVSAQEIIAGCRVFNATQNVVDAVMNAA